MSIGKEVLKKPFTQLLIRYVEASGMKQNAIASAAGITYNYLHCLLIETRNPSEQVVRSLARALRLSPEQTGAFLAAAGYAPSLDLLQPSVPAVAHVDGSASVENSPAGRLAHRCYRLAQEIPQALQTPFFDEMSQLFEYARYKYLLCGGTRLTDLHYSDRTRGEDQRQISFADTSSLDLLATLVGELYSEQEWDGPKKTEAASEFQPQVADMLASIDQLTGSILAGELSAGVYRPRLVEQIREVLRQGVPWEIRRRVAEALPGICKFDVAGACQIAELLRLDRDEKYGVDIRRRVVEALASLFEADSSSLPIIIDCLRPQPGDDIYVALATGEACGDIQAKMKALRQHGAHESRGETALPLLLSAEQVEIIKIQRQLLVDRQGTELECLQFSLALHDLLCAPDAMLLSLREGLQSAEKLVQLVAARHLERLLPMKPVEALQLYKQLLQQASSRNVRRTVVRAFPSLLGSLQEGSLPTRTLARTVMLTLASDSDVHIRRTVADYAMQLFHIDREFLLAILRHLHQDRDQAIRHRLQPVALRLAQVWLVWYAETAGLVRTTKRRSGTPFGE